MKDCIDLIISDLHRVSNSKNSFFILLKYLITNASFKITFWFRIGTYLKSKNIFICKFLLFIVSIIYKHIQYKTGIQLPLGTKVGQGIRFTHFSCIIVNEHSIIGDYCTIFQGVTIGSKRGEKGGVPKIGNNVVVASGAQIIGNVQIGNNVFIGSNSVVICDMPENAVCGGIPSKILNMDGIINTGLYF